MRREYKFDEIGVEALPGGAHEGAPPGVLGATIDQSIYVRR